MTALVPLPHRTPSGTTAQANAPGRAADEARRARQALQRGDRAAARQAAQRAVSLAPDYEDGWLLLAAVASPHASVAYLQQALRINPASPRARQGLSWAQQRLAAAAAAATQPVQVAARPALPTQPAPRRQRLVLAAMAAAVILLSASILWRQGSQAPALAALFASPTPTATATATASPTATWTPTPLPTDTPTPTASPTLTATPTDTPTPTPLPTATLTAEPTLESTLAPTPRPKKPAQRSGPEARPAQVDSEERWIDVDLSSQTTYAMQGDTIINSFLVSTGQWPTPTVEGVFRIYVKYRSADMYGADYYLSGVPYVMYFYEGYGLHGTYWHTNFGHPMSHGCVNLRPEEAGWLFEFSGVGTIVSVHP